MSNIYSKFFWSSNVLLVGSGWFVHLVGGCLVGGQWPASQLVGGRLVVGFKKKTQ